MRLMTTWWNRSRGDRRMTPPAERHGISDGGQSGGSQAGRDGFPGRGSRPAGPRLLTRGAEFEVQARLARRVPRREDQAEGLESRGGQREVEEAHHLGTRLDRPLGHCQGNDVSRIRYIASKDGPQPQPESGGA